MFNWNLIPIDFSFFARIIDGSVALIVVLMINQKYKDIPFLKRPMLHQFFMLGFLGWTLYAILNIFVYSFGALSFDINTDIEIIGYSKLYPSLNIANFLRDICLIGFCTQMWGYYYATNLIQKGELATKKSLKMPFVHIFFVVLMVLTIIYDDVYVTIENGKVDVGGAGNSFTIFSQLIIPIVVFVIIIIRLNSVLKAIIKDPECDKRYMKKINSFRLGIIMMAMSSIWYIFWRIIGVIIYPPPSYLILFVALGLHGFWIAYPLMIYRSIIE
jgi:hypothetical protein